MIAATVERRKKNHKQQIKDEKEEDEERTKNNSTGTKTQIYSDIRVSKKKISPKQPKVKREKR